MNADGARQARDSQTREKNLSSQRKGRTRR